MADNKDHQQDRLQTSPTASKTGLVNGPDGPLNTEQTTPIGRNTKFGNPFRMKKDGGDYTRIECVKEFSNWWYADEQQELREQAKEELTGKIMRCYCLGEGDKYSNDDVIYEVTGTPTVCHGEVILQYLNQSAAQN